MDKCPVSCSAQAIVGNNLWLFAQKFNGLYVLNLLTGEFQWKGQVPFEAADGVALYQKMVYWEGKLLLIPYLAHKMAVYDIETGEFETIDIPGTEQEKRMFFHTTCLYGDMLFLFPVYDTSIIKLNLRSFEVQIANQWAAEIEPYLLHKSEPIYFSAHHVVLQEGKIFLPFFHAYGVLMLDCETMDVSIHIIGGKEQTGEYGYREICADKDYLWLAPVKSSGMIVRWNRKNGHKDFYSCSPNMEKACPIVGIMKINDDRYYKVFDKEEKNPEEALQGIVLCTRDKYFDICENEQYVSVYIDNATGIRVYNKETDQKKDYFPVVEYASTPLGKAFEESIVQESEVQNLFRLIDAIDSCKIMQKEKPLAGERIYQVSCIDY